MINGSRNPSLQIFRMVLSFVSLELHFDLVHGKSLFRQRRIDFLARGKFNQALLDTTYALCHLIFDLTVDFTADGAQKDEQVPSEPSARERNELSKSPKSERIVHRLQGSERDDPENELLHGRKEATCPEGFDKLPPEQTDTACPFSHRCTELGPDTSPATTMCDGTE